MPETAPPLLSAIVVSFNTRVMTLDCLRSLSADLQGIESEIIVVDNASRDDDASAIASDSRRQLLPTRTIAVSRAAIDQAMRISSRGGIFRCLFRRLSQTRAMCALIGLLQNRPDVGVVGPRLLNADGSMQRSCFRFPSPGRRGWRICGSRRAFRRHGKSAITAVGRMTPSARSIL